MSVKTAGSIANSEISEGIVFRLFHVVFGAGVPKVLLGVEIKSSFKPDPRCSEILGTPWLGKVVVTFPVLFTAEVIFLIKPQ